MKSTILKYGGYSSITLLVFFCISWLFLEGLSFSIQEVLGYASIVLAVSFVYFGIKHYRDEINNNKLSFLDGLKLGLLIVVMPSIVFGLYNVIYVEVINPEFMDEYYTNYANNLKSTLSTEEFQIQIAKLESEKDMFQNPFMQFFVMGVTVFLIGIIGTVISTLVLKKK